MRLRALSALLCLTVPAIALVCAIPRAGQARTQPAVSAEPQIKVEVGLVNLFATVRDSKKRILTDLTKDDFRIYEDGQEQKVAFFGKETALPITLGLLIDTSGSERFMLAAEQDAATQFLDRVLRKEDLAMVINFDVDVDLLADFTSDRGQLDRAIRRAKINAPSVSGPIQGPIPLPPRGTLFYDAIYAACKDKLVNEAGRKALVILTDADDQGSKLRLEEALEMAQRTNSVIHILLISDPRYGANTGAAKKLTEETGGRVIEVHSEKKLLEAFDQISEELRNQYTLGYYPSNAARDGKFRKIKVESTRKDTHILCRKGYYAPKD